MFLELITIYHTPKLFKQDIIITKVYTLLLSLINNFLWILSISKTFEFNLKSISAFSRYYFDLRDDADPDPIYKNLRVRIAYSLAESCPIIWQD